MVRLVRACGSKHITRYTHQKRQVGQARKSLWIETKTLKFGKMFRRGQARKSLWIETCCTINSTNGIMVRLVRACGSKLFLKCLNV